MYVAIVIACITSIPGTWPIISANKCIRHPVNKVPICQCSNCASTASFAASLNTFTLYTLRAWAAMGVLGAFTIWNRSAPPVYYIVARGATPWRRIAATNVNTRAVRTFLTLATMAVIYAVTLTSIEYTHGLFLIAFIAVSKRSTSIYAG